MEAPDFTFEFHVEGPHMRNELEDDLRAEARRRLEALAKGHTDLVGASAAVEELTPRETPFVYRARVVAYIRPENIVATEKGRTASSRLKKALSALERQVREKRRRLGEQWKQP